MTTEDRPMADPQREAFVEKLGLLGVPPFCPYCQTVVDSITRTSGRLAWNGPPEAPRTHLKPCGHVLDPPIASLKLVDPIAEAEERDAIAQAHYAAANVRTRPIRDVEPYVFPT